MKKQQLELVFDESATFVPVLRHTARSRRAAWWFEQMRRVVDAAFDWQAAPPPRPEQIPLRLAGGHA